MAFATVADLEARLGRTLVEPEIAQATAFLDDATAYLRQLVGAHVAPQRTSTITLHIARGDTRIDLPDHPVVSVDAVSIGGTAVTDFEFIEHGIVRDYGWFPSTGTLAAVEITYTHGYATAPDDLKAFCCVLAAQSLANMEDLGTPYSGNVTGVGIDDYRKSWSTEGAGLPDHVIETLRSKYGAGAYVTGFRP